MLATSGSGHAYKVRAQFSTTDLAFDSRSFAQFLPVLGRLVADSIQGILDESIAQKFSPDRTYAKHDPSRSRADITDLALEQLCTAEDLLPQ